MSRYTPTAEEATAIDLLTLAGYTVVRRRTYDRLVERARVAVALRQHAEDRVASVTRWAEDAHVEQRRLSDRLTEVATAAASLGVPITAINAALAEARP